MVLANIIQHTLRPFSRRSVDATAPFAGIGVAFHGSRPKQTGVLLPLGLRTPLLFSIGVVSAVAIGAHIHDFIHRASPTAIRVAAGQAQGYAWDNAAHRLSRSVV